MSGDEDDAEAARRALGMQPTRLPDLDPDPDPDAAEPGANARRAPGLAPPEPARPAPPSTLSDSDLVATLRRHRAEPTRAGPIAAGANERVVATRVGETAPVPTLPSAEASSDGVEVGTILAGKYELERLLGVGGMGKVWKAHHRSLGISVAVKTMHPYVALQSEYARRFRREAHAASLLNHPNVVRVLDFGDDDGLLFLVMEYLDGRSLAAWLDGLAAPPPLAEVDRILGALLDALAVAHAFGIVHRDLKPDNVFLAEVGTLRVVKVLDFGLAHVDDARDAGPTLTREDAIAGTPDYMSPEQCRSLAVGPSADLYSLGCILTTLLQLRPPFTGRAAVDTMAKHMFSKPAALTRPPGSEPVPPLLEKLRIDLLAKVPERRPRDAAEAKLRLIEALSPSATEARLPTRKGDVPLGDRAARAPAWATAPTQAVLPAHETKTIGVYRLPPPAQAVGIAAEHETALAAEQVEIVVVQSPAEVAAAGLALLVLDVGSSVREGGALLGEIRAVAGTTKVLVCAAGFGADQLNALVAAGAADVARYPITPDGLARKVDRILRRGR